MAPIRATAARLCATVPSPPLHDDWRVILWRAWSARLMVLAIVLSGAEAILPLVLPSWPLPHWAAPLITFAVVSGALWARLSVQRSLKP